MPDRKPNPSPSPGRRAEHLDYLLTAYLFENISAAGKTEIERHLAACAACRAQLETLRETLGLASSALDDGGREYVFEERRKQRVIEAAKAGRLGLFSRVGASGKWVWRLGAVAAVLVICAAIFTNSRKYPGMDRLSGGRDELADAKSYSVNHAPSAGAAQNMYKGVDEVRAARITAEGETKVNVVPEKDKASGLLIYRGGYADDYTDKDALYLRHNSEANGKLAESSGGAKVTYGAPGVLLIPQTTLPKSADGQLVLGANPVQFSPVTITADPQGGAAPLTVTIDALTKAGNGAGDLLIHNGHGSAALNDGRADPNKKAMKELMERTNALEMKNAELERRGTGATNAAADVAIAKEAGASKAPNLPMFGVYYDNSSNLNLNSLSGGTAAGEAKKEGLRQENSGLQSGLATKEGELALTAPSRKEEERDALRIREKQVTDAKDEAIAQLVREHMARAALLESDEHATVPKPALGLQGQQEKLAIGGLVQAWALPDAPKKDVAVAAKDDTIRQQEHAISDAEHLRAAEAAQAAKASELNRQLAAQNEELAQRTSAALAGSKPNQQLAQQNDLFGKNTWRSLDGFEREFFKGSDSKDDKTVALSKGRQFAGTTPSGGDQNLSFEYKTQQDRANEGMLNELEGIKGVMNNAVAADRDKTKLSGTGALDIPSTVTLSGGNTLNSSGNSITWSAVSEFNNAGFNVVRGFTANTPPKSGASPADPGKALAESAGSPSQYGLFASGGGSGTPPPPKNVVPEFDEKNMGFSLQPTPAIGRDLKTINLAPSDVLAGGLGMDAAKMAAGAKVGESKDKVIVRQLELESEKAVSSGGAVNSVTPEYIIGGGGGGSGLGGQRSSGTTGRSGRGGDVSGKEVDPAEWARVKEKMKQLEDSGAKMPSATTMVDGAMGSNYGPPAAVKPKPADTDGDVFLKSFTGDPDLATAAGNGRELAKLKAEQESSANSEAKPGARQEMERRQKDDERKLNMALDQSRVAFETGRYDLARQQAEKVLELDPGNADAVAIQIQTQDKAYDARKKFIAEEYKLDRESADRTKIPHSDYLVYPPDWRDIAKRTTEGKSDGGFNYRPQDGYSGGFSVSADDIALKGVKEEKPTLHTYGESKLSLNNTATRDWKTQDDRLMSEGYLLTPGLTKSDKAIASQPGNANTGFQHQWYEKALGSPVMIQGLSSNILPKPDTQGELAIYDIRDLSTTVTDFPGPKVNAGAAANGQTIDPYAAPKTPPALKDVDLGSLLKDKILAEKFKDPQFTMDVSGGKLVVFQTPETQKQIAEVLKTLREKASNDGKFSNFEGVYGFAPDGEKGRQAAGATAGPDKTYHDVYFDGDLQKPPSRPILLLHPRLDPNFPSAAKLKSGDAPIAQFVPPTFETRTRKVIVEPERCVQHPVPAVFETRTRKVVVSPEHDGIPAVFKDEEYTVAVKPESCTTETIPAVIKDEPYQAIASPARWQFNSPITEELYLRSYHFFREENPKLDFAQFLRRPASVRPEPLSDDGLDEDVYIEKYGTRPFVDCARDHLSTFGMDVDTASYTLARAALREGKLPPVESVKVEEFLNYFKQDYQVKGDEAFGVFAESARSPFADATPLLYDTYAQAQDLHTRELLRIGIKSRDPRPNERKPAMLTFVIDNSGSMSHAAAKDTPGSRLALLKDALKGLVESLNPEDAVSIVGFSDQAELILPRTQARQKARILEAVDSMTAGGATNIEAGLMLGFRLADDSFAVNGVNRMILCGDGAANLGANGPDEILKLVKVFAQRGIDLSTVGVGRAQINDPMLRKLADEGNGSAHYADSVAEAKKIFAEKLPPHLNVLARDAKVQVDFNVDSVKSYRLLGYEKRKIADKDFRNDKVDAGDVAHSTLVTALYELVRQPGAHGPLGKVYLRWKDAGSPRLEVVERNYPLDEGICAGPAQNASSDFRFLACVGRFAELLRESKWTRHGSYAEVLTELDNLPADYKAKPAWSEVRDLVTRALQLNVSRWQAQLAQ